MKQLYLLFALLIIISCKEKNTSITEVDKKIEKVAIPETKDDRTDSIPYKLLQGRWMNVENNLSTLVFDGNKTINQYDGFDNDTEIYFTIDNSCTNQPNTGNAEENDLYINTTGASQECYLIVKLDKEELQMQYMGMQNILKFVRITSKENN